MLTATSTSRALLYVCSLFMEVPQKYLRISHSATSAGLALYSISIVTPQAISTWPVDSFSAFNVTRARWYRGEEAQAVESIIHSHFEIVLKVHGFADEPAH